MLFSCIMSFGGLTFKRVALTPMGWFFITANNHKFDPVETFPGIDQVKRCRHYLKKRLRQISPQDVMGSECVLPVGYFGSMFTYCFRVKKTLIKETKTTHFAYYLTMYAEVAVKQQLLHFYQILINKLSHHNRYLYVYFFGIILGNIIRFYNQHAQYM